MSTDCDFPDDQTADPSDGRTVLLPDPDEDKRFKVQTVINLIECKNRGNLSVRVMYEYDCTVIAMLRSLRKLYGDDPAANQEFVKGAEL